MIPVSIWVNGPTFNDDHFAESALVPPSQMEDQWTWDDFVEIGRKLVRYDSSGQVIRWAYRPGDWKVWVHNAGGWMFDRYVDPTQVTLHAQPVRTALRFLQEVYQTRRPRQSQHRLGPGRRLRLDPNRPQRDPHPAKRGGDI